MEIKRLPNPYQTLGMKIGSHNTRCPSPEHSGSDSASVHLVEGNIVWHCHACGAGGSIIDAYMLEYGVTEKEAIQMLEDEYGVSDPQPNFTQFEKKKKEENLFPTQKRPRFNFEVNGREFLKTKEGYKLYYKDADYIDFAPFIYEGKLMSYAVFRWDLPTSKVIRPAYYDGSSWKLGTPKEPQKRPIYKMGLIDKFTDALVVIVEGEKCMRVLQDSLQNAAQKYESFRDEHSEGVIVTSLIGGSNAVRRTELSHLKGRNVILVKDSDEPGEKFAKEIKTALPNVKIISVGGRDGYDVVDWLEDGNDVRTLFKMEEDETDVPILEQAMHLAATIEKSQVKTFFSQLAKAEPDALLLDDILNTLKTSLNVNLGALRKLWTEVNKESAVDYPSMVAYEFIRRHEKLVIYTSKSYWIYNGTHWERHDDDVVRGILFRVIEDIVPEGEHDKASILSKSFQILSAIVATQQDVLNMRSAPPPIINTQNGELHIEVETGEVVLRPHDPKSGLTYCLDVVYDPDAKCREYDKAILEIFENDKDMVRHWHEVAGYIIQPRRNLKNFFICHGPRGHNGKSQLFKTVSALIGQDNIAAMELSNFGEGRFDKSALVGKIMLLDDDLKKGIKLSDGLLKSLSEEKLITTEYKNKDLFQFVNYAAPVMLCNHLPATSDLTKAMFTRANILPFNAYFAPDDPKTDTQLFERIRKNELSGVLNRFISGLRRLRMRTRWDYPEKCVEARNQWMMETNSLYLFVSERVQQNTNARVYADELYPSYSAWCLEQGMSRRYILHKKSFRAGLIELELPVTSANNNRGRWKLEGYELAD